MLPAECSGLELLEAPFSRPTRPSSLRLCPLAAVLAGSSGEVERTVSLLVQELGRWFLELLVTGAP